VAVHDGRLEVLDELYQLGLAARARAWITPLHVSFSDLELEMSARAPILVSGSGTLRRTDDSIGCRRFTSSASPVAGSAAVRD
jgi:hypothetical protein